MLVTHKLDVLHSVDNILVLGEGKVLAQGSLSEVVAQGVDLKSVLAEAKKAAEEDSQHEQSQAPSADEGKEGVAERAAVEAGKQEVQKVQESAKGPEGPAAGGKADGGQGAGVKAADKAAGAPKRSTSFHLVEREARAQGAVSTEIYLTYLRELQVL